MHRAVISVARPVLIDLLLPLCPRRSCVPDLEAFNGIWQQFRWVVGQRIGKRSVERNYARVEHHARLSMQFQTIFKPMVLSRRTRTTRFLFTAAWLMAASVVTSQVSAAAEIQLSGSGTFRPPSAEHLAALPADLGFSRSDLASGHWSFSVRYEDSAQDADPDPLVGQYAGSIRAYRLVIGATAVDLPVDQAQIIVSDGGGGFANRESIRVEATALVPAGRLRLSWVQVNQQAKGVDLRGPAGSLTGDALPAYAAVAHLDTTSPFDRFLELRIDRPGGDAKPLLYLGSSQLTVTASPTTAP